MKKKFCELKIIPQKEKGFAEIQIYLEKSTWKKNEENLKILTEAIPKGALLFHRIENENSLVLTIHYAVQLPITEKLEQARRTANGKPTYPNPNISIVHFFSFVSLMVSSNIFTSFDELFI